MHRNPLDKRGDAINISLVVVLNSFLPQGPTLCDYFDKPFTVEFAFSLFSVLWPVMPTLFTILFTIIYAKYRVNII